MKQTSHTVDEAFWMKKEAIDMAYYRKIGKSWYFTVRVWDASGQRRTIERYGGDTQKEAKQACIDFLANCEVSSSGRIAKICTMHYADYLDDFYNLYVCPNLRENTQERYRSVIDRIIKPALGNYTLEKLTPMNIQMEINTMAERYAASTVAQILNIIKKSLNEAVRFYNYLPRNPALAVRIPKRIRECDAAVMSDRKKIFNLDDIEKIFEASPITVGKPA